MRRLISLMEKYKKILLRKIAWQRYSWLASAHGFEIKRFKNTKNSKFIYLNESPFTITEIDGIDFGSSNFRNKVVYSNFDRPEKCQCDYWYNKSAWLCLMDHLVSMPKNVLDNHDNRTHKAVLIRSSKMTHPGHHLRSKFKKNKYLDIIDTNNKNIKDLRQIYENYKFVLIIENVQYKGYVSEQIWGAIKSGCIPIYYGDFKKLEEYNLKNIANIEDFWCDNQKSITKLPKILVNNFANENFNTLKKLRNKCLNEFMAYPSMFLIRGEY